MVHCNPHMKFMLMHAYLCIKCHKVHKSQFILERAKHSFFALPNPLSCSVMNKICLNQISVLNGKTPAYLCFLLSHSDTTLNVVNLLCSDSAVFSWRLGHNQAPKHEPNHSNHTWTGKFHLKSQ